ncbi:MAG: prefoldin subunit alpha [Candidatus Aenigmarchaeota archaeon]|nr:prefoldin subunit alpha [Candidatus Aenigmarchaeota archaeon]
MADAQKTLHEKSILYQVMNVRLEEMAKQGSALEIRMNELEAAESSLNELVKTKVGSEILLPVGAGCYAYGNLAATDKFMVEIGAGLVKKMTLGDAVNIIKDKKNEIEKVAGQLNAQANELRQSMDQIAMEIQALNTRQQNEAKGGAIRVD